MNGQERAIFIALEAGLASGLFWDLVWCGYYTYLAKWWQNRFGRAIFAKSVVICSLLVATGLPLFWPDISSSYPLQWVDVGLVWSVTPVMIWRISANHYYRPPEKSLRLAARTAARRLCNACRWCRMRRERRSSGAAE